MEKKNDPRQSSKARRRREARTNSDYGEYCASIKTPLVTTRFNNTTWNENIEYRKKHPVLGCVYATPDINSARIAPESILFVLEMNNDMNRIMGIGMVRNHAFVKKHRVYSNDNYNRYAYVGKNRIDRDDMTEEEDTMMRAFDALCFTGARHMKRLQGIKAFPTDMLYKCKEIVDLVDFVRNMFKKHMENK